MINQALAAKWITFQFTDPPKAFGKLETVDGCRCCLGNLCHITMKPDVEQRYLPYITYGDENELLPAYVSEKLNITPSGDFTKRGQRFVEIFLRENLVRRLCITASFTLTGVNDHTNACHHTIGLLIQHLAWIEKELGIECFVHANSEQPHYK